MMKNIAIRPELTEGTILHDNNPRMKHRTVKIIRINGDHAVCQATNRLVYIRCDRIHSDDKPRRSGFSTIAPAKSGT